jgi:hypothetical protein
MSDVIIRPSVRKEKQDRLYGEFRPSACNLATAKKFLSDCTETVKGFGFWITCAQVSSKSCTVLQRVI